MDKVTHDGKNSMNYCRGCARWLKVEIKQSKIFLADLLGNAPGEVMTEVFDVLLRPHML